MLRVAVLAVFCFLGTFAWHGVLPLEIVPFQLTNDYSNHTIENIVFTTSYGSMIGRVPTTSLSYQENLSLRFSPSCGQGTATVTTTYDIYSSSGSLVAKGEAFIVAVTSLSVDFTRSTEFSSVLYLPGTTLEQAVISVSFSIIPKAQSSILFPTVQVTPSVVDLNLTICNPYSASADLLAFPQFWGVTNQREVPTSIEAADCASFMIFPKCNGGLLGATLSYIISNNVTEIDFVLTTTRGEYSEGSGFSPCDISGNYSEHNFVNCELSIT